MDDCTRQNWRLVSNIAYINTKHNIDMFGTVNKTIVLYYLCLDNVIMIIWLQLLFSVTHNYY